MTLGESILQIKQIAGGLQKTEGYLVWDAHTIEGVKELVYLINKLEVPELVYSPEATNITDNSIEVMNVEA